VTRGVQAGRVGAYGALPVPQMTPDLVGLIRSGQVYSLAVNFEEGMVAPGEMISYTLSPRLRHGDLEAGIFPASAAAEVISMSVHVGTHIDGLCHIGEFQDDAGKVSELGSVRLYNGPGQTRPAAECVTHQGQIHLDASQIPPIVTRAILLDVARYKHTDVLPDAYSITPDDVRGTLEQQNLEVRPGTAVLVRTGFYQHLRDRNCAYTDALAGITLDAAQLLCEQGMIMVGADTMSVEVLAAADRGHPVHRYLIVQKGVPLLENLYLEDLALRACHEFVLIVTPLRLTGATGSWVHPIAIA
jgi:kynurenine formamidase